MSEPNRSEVRHSHPQRRCSLAGAPGARPIEIDVMSGGHRHGGLETLSIPLVVVGSKPVTARVGWREQQNAHASDRHLGGFH